MSKGLVSTDSPWPRRAFHLLAGSSIPVGALFMDRATAIAALAVLAGLAIALEALRLRWTLFNDWLLSHVVLFRESERTKPTGSTVMVIAALAAFLLFAKPVAIVALLVLAVGDPIASAAGRGAPGPRIAGKSLVGAGAFAIAATLAGLGASLHADVSLGWWLVVGAIVGAATEVAPLRVDDNATIPLVAGAAMTLVA